MIPKTKQLVRNTDGGIFNRSVFFGSMDTRSSVCFSNMLQLVSNGMKLANMRSKWTSRSQPSAFAAKEDDDWVDTRRYKSWVHEIHENSETHPKCYRFFWKRGSVLRPDWKSWNRFIHWQKKNPMKSHVIFDRNRSLVKIWMLTCCHDPRIRSAWRASRWWLRWCVSIRQQGL